MVKITTELSDEEHEEHEKLVALAAARTEQTRGKHTFTVGDCIRGFARSCQPGGGGWVHPMVHEVKGK